MSTIRVTDELSIEVLGPDDIEGPPAVTIKAERPNSTWRLTVRAQEIKPLVAALSEADGQLVSFGRELTTHWAGPLRGL